MRAALLVFGIAFVAGQKFQEGYKTTSTSVVLANPGYFQRKSEVSQRNQFSNDFQERTLTTSISGTPQRLQTHNNRGDRFQQNSFGPSLFHSSDVDRQQRFEDQVRSGRFFQGEREPLNSQYGRYQGEQRRYQQNNRESVFQQNSQDFFQQGYQDDQLPVNSQQNIFSHNSRGNRFRQTSQKNRFQEDIPRDHFQLNDEGSIFQKYNQESQLNLNNQAGQFQLNDKEAELRHSGQDSFFQGHSQTNRPSSAFVGENIPFRFSTSEENNLRNSFDHQGQRLRGSHFGQADSRFLEKDFDVASLPAGAQFHLDSVDASFQCSHRPYGFYADQSSGCRVFHVCNPDLFVDGHSQNLQSSFMCGEGYIFDQRRMTCVQEHLALPCHEASDYYLTYDN